MENTQSLYLQTSLTPYQQYEDQLCPTQDKYSKIPSDERLNDFAMTRQEFEAIINYVDQMEPISKNTIIKKCDSGLAFTIACMPDVDEVAVYILFKKKRLMPQGIGGNCTVTPGWNVRDKCVVSYRSGKAEHISEQERYINFLLAKYKHRFVVGDVFDSRGYCSKKEKPFASGFSRNEKGEYVPVKRECPLPETDKNSDSRPVFDKTGIILETMDGCLPLFRKGLSPDIVFHIIHEVLVGLVILHEEFKIVHLDIKPDNILLKDGTVKIADFGHSKLQYKPVNQLFTYYFQSPEIIALGKQKLLKDCIADHPMDIWSLGVTIVNMIWLANTNGEENAVYECGKIWKQWHLLCLKMHSTIDKYDFQKLIDDFLVFVEKTIKEYGNEEYLKLFPLLKQCLVVDPAQRIRAVDALKMAASLIST